MKFRKKPIVIEAEQYHSINPTFIDGVCYQAHNGFKGNPHIHTLEGIMELTDGDWVITGVNGEKYPCKPDIFEKTYEKVEE
jgi:hypothetical protein